MPGRAGEGHIYLANAFREISQLARRDRTAKLTQFVAMLGAVLPFIGDGDAYFTSMLLVDGLLGSFAERIGAA